MNTSRIEVRDPLAPEVLAVIRSAFDGYSDPEPGAATKSTRQSKEPRPGKSTNKPATRSAYRH